MKILEVNIPGAYFLKGLNDIKMDRLGKVVILAGKNGSGKTRILNSIRDALNQKPSLSQVEGYKTEINSQKKTIESLTTQLVALESISDNNESSPNRELIEMTKIKIKAAEDSIKLREQQTEFTLLKTDVLTNDPNSIIDFVPKSLYLEDYSSFSLTTIRAAGSEIDRPGTGTLSRGVLSRIKTIQDNWFNATHPLSKITDNEKQTATEEYNRLNQLVKTFLNTELDRNSSGDPVIFGFPIGSSMLSQGQIILLQLSVAIFCQSNSLSGLILFLDEPENHLHPKALIETIDIIIGAVPNGQVWISTHSIPLLSHFDSSQIWFVDDGKISHAGSIPEKVVKSLVGDDIEISKLQDFINLPSQLALNRYALESLVRPNQVITGSQDPQITQIHRTLSTIIEKRSKIKILDYGSGKCRLLTNLKEKYPAIENSPIEYVAYDPDTSNSDYCKTLVTTILNDSKRHYFNNLDELFTNHDVGSFDVVIMCNVLHEIDPSMWLTLFKRGGELSKILSPEGYLLIVEDTLIPNGEKAYEKGFIVLNTTDLKLLFKVKSTDLATKLVSDTDRNGRLQANLIHNSLLYEIDQNSRLDALKSVNERAKRGIKNVRQQTSTYRNGRIHAFWVLQYANSQLALDEYI